MKSNAGCNNFESNKIDCRTENVWRAEENKEGDKNKTKKKMVEADMEIAALNKQKTVVRVGEKEYNLQCK